MKVVGSCDSRQCRTVSNRLHWRAADRCLGLLRRYLQIGKVALGSRSDPQGDSSFGCVEPQIVDDEAGLFSSVHVESRLAAFDFDLEFGPDSWLQVNVRLVLFGSILPRLGEVEVRMRTILRRVVAPDLIVSTPVGGSEIDVLVTPVGLEAKSDANEPARAFGGATCR